eukprot:CAMPEP_0201884682 /NCGR_PEP_ID=MMETSP0902-20130614/17492_1 /ASSEMBLY_ACC=CAM_ASM_000551 /TAXON_ID=420261 /ORGANISM="Thalassiosira antarctica, Strain CCMP982" /LENGTH=462 /DNA_ID=CAMNT_0048413683 /DNA_START=58 /DNA_END=1446 /DNA_ORIENTATION=+
MTATQRMIALAPLALLCSVTSAFAPLASRPFTTLSHHEFVNVNGIQSSTRHNLMPLPLDGPSILDSTTLTLSFLNQLNENILTMDQTAAEQLAGPFFGASLFPYLGFLFFLNVPQNETPKGVTVGFATCLLFVFLTIPAAIAAKVWYDVSLADCDWIHGSAESMLTITNLVTVVAFRQALSWKEQQEQSGNANVKIPESVVSYDPMVKLVCGLTVLAFITALVPALAGAQVHTPYLDGFMDVPSSQLPWTATHPEPENSLTIATWIIHISSLVEWLVAMGFCWRWADSVGNPRWKGLTWGLLPLHTSGITACTYHLLYNSIPVLVPLQAFLTFVGNTTAMIAAYRIAVSNGWTVPWGEIPFLDASEDDSDYDAGIIREDSQTLVGFEDLGDALAKDNDYIFLVKLFAGCAVASYVVKYGEIWFDFPFQSELNIALAFIFIPSLLNAYKWWKRSQDPTFDGFF